MQGIILTGITFSTHPRTLTGDREMRRKPVTGEGEMPREKIESVENPGWCVDVAWGREAQYVAVASRTNDQAARDASAKEWSEGMYPGEHVGFWVNFSDRAAINALIRSLRKARDSAFGLDE